MNNEKKLLRSIFGEDMDRWSVEDDEVDNSLDDDRWSVEFDPDDEVHDHVCDTCEKLISEWEFNAYWGDCKDCFDRIWYDKTDDEEGPQDKWT